MKTSEREDVGNEGGGELETKKGTGGGEEREVGKKREGKRGGGGGRRIREVHLR